jgi:uncharacterized sporulation protein YeaH/YhbH (DUF444 family)
VANAEQQTSSTIVGGHGNGSGDNADRDYITKDDLIQDHGGDGDGAGEAASVMETDDVELFEELVNCLNHNDVLFGSPRRLENFREMKQAAIDLLYKDYLKH